MKDDNHSDDGDYKAHVALEITQLEPAQESSITSKIRRKLEEISFTCSIFHVPPEFRSRKENAYQPIMVSIGPYHHNKPHLHHMEIHKLKYLNSLLNRTLTLDSTLDSCIQALKDLEPKIRACYQGNISSLSSDEFLTMILLDGGFIIELFLRYYVTNLRARDDTLLKSSEKINDLRTDLILLENQIPFFVLRKIYSLVPIPNQCNKSMSELSLKFFKNMMPREIHTLHEKYSFEGSNHLLDLIWKCFLPSFYKGPIISDSDTGRDIHSASKLHQLGIKVKRSYAESILDVKFSDGKLIIPSLRISNQMETVFRNLIALEHCYGDKMKYVTSYTYLMRGLLHSEHDVRLLYRQGILLDYVKHKERVVDLFKNLCEGVDLDKFYYQGMWQELKKYKRTKWEVWYYSLNTKSSTPEVCGKWGITCGLLFIVLILCVALSVILYLFFHHERHQS